MENRVKAIFVDSEGTLKTKDKSITLETKEIIKKLEQQGIFVVITSGLPRFITKKISLNANASRYLISSNGADIYDIKEEQSLDGAYLDKKFIQDLYNKYHLEYNLIFGTGEAEYVNNFNPYSKGAQLLQTSADLLGKDIYQCHVSQKNNSWEDSNLDQEIALALSHFPLALEEYLGSNLYHKLLINKNHLNKLSLLELTKVIRAIRFLKLQSLRQEILTYYENLVGIGNESVDFRNYQEGGEVPWFSLNRKGVTKGMAIRKLCEYLKISLEEVIGFGNDYNDKSMLEVVKTFICPSDSIDSVIKSDKSLIYDRNDGISKVLEKVYEKNR